MPSGVDPLRELSDNKGVRDNPPPHTAAAEKKANTMANTTHHKDPAADGARGARADNARHAAAEQRHHEAYHYLPSHGSWCRPCQYELAADLDGS